MLKILFLGDVVGRPGRKILQSHLKELQQEFSPDLTIVNGENSAGGIGIDATCADEIFAAGAQLITTGNHIWGRKEFIPYLEKHRDRVIRPVNYAPGAPGAGYCKWTSQAGVKVGVLNAMGRIFMGELLDCPFRGVDAALEQLSDCSLVFLDFHAEATSEKIAMAHYVDGRIAVQVGTHTHVQTADDRIFPKGLAYITDVGMCGPYGGVIGMGHEAVVQKFISGRPSRFDVADGEVVLNGVVIDCDEQSGKSVAISRINRRY